MGGGRWKGCGEGAGIDMNVCRLYILKVSLWPCVKRSSRSLTGHFSNGLGCYQVMLEAITVYKCFFLFFSFLFLRFLNGHGFCNCLELSYYGNADNCLKVIGRKLSNVMEVQIIG